MFPTNEEVRTRTMANYSFADVVKSANKKRKNKTNFVTKILHIDVVVKSAFESLPNQVCFSAFVSLFTISATPLSRNAAPVLRSIYEMVALVILNVYLIQRRF